MQNTEAVYFRKSLEELFAEATKLAKSEYGVKRTAKGWQKKFNLIKQDYSAFIAKLANSSRDRANDDLFKTPVCYASVNKLEHGKAKHDPTAQLFTDKGFDGNAAMSSSRKRM